MISTDPSHQQSDDENRKASLHEESIINIIPKNQQSGDKSW